MNTFKKGDAIKLAHNGKLVTVKYTDGPYVYHDGGHGHNAHYENCMLVPKFGVGDYVKSHYGNAIVKAVNNDGLTVEYLPGQKDSWMGRCSNVESFYTLVSKAGTVNDFLKAGQLINAIKEYRAIHGVGLKEAKDAVEALQRKEDSGQTLGDILNTALANRAASKAKYKVGDKVHTVDDKDDVGTVLAVRDGKYAVSWPSMGNDEDGCCVWKESELFAAKPTGKFKVGDRISIRDNVGVNLVTHYDQYWKGTGKNDFVVIRVDRDMIEYGYAGTDNGPWAGTDHFEHYRPTTSKTVPTIVVRYDEGKGYRPNDKPRVHNSNAEAMAEAERLARANPGVKFDTFTLVSSSIATAPVPGKLTTVRT